MQFVKDKNFTEREKLIYEPVLHWMYVLKPVLIVSIIIAAFFVVCSYTVSFIGMSYQNVLIYLIIISIVIFSFTLIINIYLYHTIEYGITNKRLMIKKGVFTIMTKEMPIDRIESIYCRQSVCGRIFKYGTIYISGIGGSMPFFYKVSKPYALRRVLIDAIEKSKMIHVLKGDIPPPSVRPEPQPAAEDPLGWGYLVSVHNADTL